MAGFDLMSIVNKKTAEEAKAPASAYEVVQLDVEELQANEKNTIYSIDNIEELKNAIELAGGVKQNLVVEPKDQETGKYKIIAGHRRWTACKELTAEGKEEYKKVPCLIEYEKDDTKKELLLIYTNASARELTDAEKAKQSQRATELLTDIKRREGLTGRVRDLVAKMLNTTAAQIGRYQGINNNLHNQDLKEAFKAGSLKVSAAYEASSLTDEGQAAAAEKLAQKGALSIEDVKEIKKPAKQEAGTRYNNAEYTRCEEKVNKVGYEGMEPCELCTLATGCINCCATCKEPCNNKQRCNKLEQANKPKPVIVDINNGEAVEIMEGQTAIKELEKVTELDTKQDQQQEENSFIVEGMSDEEIEAAADQEAAARQITWQAAASIIKHLKGQLDLAKAMIDYYQKEEKEEAAQVEEAKVAIYSKLIEELREI